MISCLVEEGSQWFFFYFKLCIEIHCRCPGTFFKVVSVLFYGHRNEQCRGDLLESLSSCNKDFRGCGYATILSLAGQPGPVTGRFVVCVDAEIPPITRVSSMPPGGEREKQLELVGAEGEVWFISTNSFFLQDKEARLTPALGDGQRMVLPNWLSLRI